MRKLWNKDFLMQQCKYYESSYEGFSIHVGTSFKEKLYDSSVAFFRSKYKRSIARLYHK